MSPTNSLGHPSYSSSPIPAPIPSPTPSTPSAAATSDGPGGGDPGLFEQLTGIPSNTTLSNPVNSDNDETQKPEPIPASTTTPGIVIDPSIRDDATADGPAGGDPGAFEELTGVSSDWPDDNDDGESGAGSVDAGALGGLAGALTIKEILGGIFSGITAGTLAI